MPLCVQAAAAAKTPAIAMKMVEGRLAKLYAERILLDQVRHLSPTHQLTRAYPFPRRSRLHLLTTGPPSRHS